MENLNIPYEWLVAYWVFNAAIQALPKPSDASKVAYVWVYNFTHGLAGNIALLGKRTNGNGAK